MARLASEAKLCFYPAHEDAVAGICKHLTCNSDKPTEVNILDPCCGQGAAIKQIADHLKLSYDRVYCVEMDQGRGEIAKEALPGAHIMFPADFLGTFISGKSFGLIYCNPPFGDELGGGKREEMAFVERATRLLHHKGLLALVVPINAIHGNGRFVSYMDSRFQNISCYRFPDSCRNYREVVIFAQPRHPALTDDQLTTGTLYRMGWRYGYGSADPKRLPNLGDYQPQEWNDGHPSFDREDDVRLFYLPHSWKPSKFEKSSYTDAEMLKFLANSRLKKHLVTLETIPPKEPPISISQNHLSMLLGSGELDGVVYYFDDFGNEVVPLRHVVRGVTSKQEYFNEELSSVRVDKENETVHVKQVISQVIHLDLHGFDMNGKLHKWSQGQEPEPDEEDEPGDVPVGESPPGPASYPEDYDFDLAAQLARMTPDNGCAVSESANAQARLQCMKEGKAFVPEEWEEFIEEYERNHQPSQEAA